MPKKINTDTEAGDTGIKKRVEKALKEYVEGKNVNLTFILNVYTADRQFVVNSGPQDREELSLVTGEIISLFYDGETGELEGWM